MAKMRCLNRYENLPHHMTFAAGTVFEATPEVRQYLMADAPGCFEDVEDVKALDEPPRDKAIKAPRRKGRASE